MLRKTFVVLALFAAFAAAGPSFNAVSAPAVAPITSALKLPPPKAGRTKPLVVVLTDNAGSETTDVVIPYAVLKDSGVADVQTVSSAPGPVHLFRVLSIVADRTIAAFDAATPFGADIVVVPAMVHPKDPRILAFIRAQAAKGAVIVSICEGAEIVAAAGLTDGKHATTHWASLDRLARAYPKTIWVRDRRYVQDGDLISTTGVTASIPVSLALVEAIGGSAVADATAVRVGVRTWGADHRTAAFGLSADLIAVALTNKVLPWRREVIEIPVADGFDDIAVALQADSWTRTWRNLVVTTNAGRGEVVSAHGLRLRVDAKPTKGALIVPNAAGAAASELDTTLSQISKRYGPRTAQLAKLGLEYP